MTANTVNGSGNEARSGAQTLVLLAAPLNCLILQALEEGPKPQVELRREAGAPAQTTLRAQLKRLAQIGAIEKHRRNRFPGALEYELTKSGHELLLLAAVLERWLERGPNGPLVLGSSAAKAAIKALAEGWSTTMLRALAAGPLSLTELDSVIGSLSYPALERRLSAMRLAALLEARKGSGRGTPYAVTDWLRQGIAPLIVAARWERRHLPNLSTPLARLDAETILLLAAPLMRLPAGTSGSCRMAAEISNGKGRQLAGVLVEMDDGRVASCATQLDGSPDAWALGSARAWLDAVVGPDLDRLELGGDCRLAAAFVEALHEALFDVRSGIRP